MTRRAALVVLALSVSAAVLSAARIYTNPKPDDHLKKLFPEAAAFSPLAGEPLHFKAYAADPQKDPSAPLVGFVFWTTDLVPREFGYHGPLHILVGMDLTGIIRGIVIDYHSEPYGYFSVDPPEFVEQFKAKSIRDPFKVGADIDAVSTASLTINSATRAVRDSARLMARQFLKPDQVKR